MPTPTEPHRLLILNWRDRTHPEGGGSEQYVEEVAASMIASGWRVTVVCADHGFAPRDEVNTAGITMRRRGGRRSVYPRAAAFLLSHGRQFDVVLDVQNGLPFWSRLLTRRPTVVLVHHVHREQWPVVFPPRQAALGWWLESRLAPRVYRGRPYIVVSDATATELASLGVRREDITVVHNGVEHVEAPEVTRSPTPQLCIVGRLVPHKRVEIALRSVAALLTDFPDLHLSVVGEGYWHPELVDEANRLGVADRVTFTGHVGDATKHQVMASSWLLLVPSLKEGWGLTVIEAASHGVPAVAFHGSGGLDESIVDGISGVLVTPGTDPQSAFTSAVRSLLVDAERRISLGDAARRRAATFDWATTGRTVSDIVSRASSNSGRRKQEKQPQRVP